jgi:hypothetical protein
MNRKNKWKVVAAGLMIGAAALTMTSCMDDSANTPIEQTPVAFVSIYHASPDAPDLNILVDGQRLNTSPFDYGDYSGYLRFFTGARKLQFGPYNASNVVIDTTTTFAENKVYSVYVYDNYSNASVLITDDNAADPASGKAKIRIINLAPDQAEVSLKAGAAETPILNDLAFGEASAFTEIDANTYDFKVVPTAGGDVLLQLPAEAITSGGFYTIVVRGYKTPPSGNTNVLSADIYRN